MTFKNRKEEILAQHAEKMDQLAREKANQDFIKTQELAKTVMLHADHPIPTTRRQLLGAGLMSGFSVMAVPSIFTIAAQSAYGVECAKGGAAGAQHAPGYLHIELSGGYSAARNFVPGKQEAGAAFQPLPVAGYATIGYGPTQAPGAIAPDTSLVGTMHPTSQLLAGMKEVMSAAALGKTAVAAICAVSGDDTANNPHNPVQLVSKIAGNFGSLIQIGGTTNGTNTLGRTAPLNIAQDPGLGKAAIANEAAVGNLVNPGLLAARFNNDPQAAVRVAELAHKLSASKLAQFQQKDLNQQVKDLIECGYLGAKDLLTDFTPAKLQVSTDTTLNTAYNAIAFNTAFGVAGNQQAMLFSKLMSEGMATTSSLVLAGYDYHGQGLPAQDAKDKAAGQAIGLALEVAHRKGQPLFVAVSTDGSVTFNGGGTADRLAASADNGARSMILMFAIGATEQPKMNFSQIGKFNDGGAVDTSYLATSNTAAVAALCVAYNYASFAGKLPEYQSALAAAGQADPFSANAKQYQAFAPKV